MKDGWNLKPWKEVLQIKSGRNQKEVENPDGIYPILGSAGKVMGYADSFLCEEGTTIIGRKGTIDNPLYIETKFWNVDTAFGLIAGEELHPKYLFYFCFGFNFKNLDKGTTLPSLVKKDLEKILIPVPTIAEQFLVVTILDEAFAVIEQAKAKIEKNIANAKELFQSKLNAIFSQKGEGLEEKTIGSILVIKSGGTPSRAKKEYWENGEIAWYSSGELNDLYTQEPERYITEKALENSNAKRFPAGSLLIGMYDTAALKMSILDREATFNQAICGVEPNRDYNLAFIMHAVNAKKTEILSQRRGVRQKNLNQSKIKNISIHFPDITQQNSVVEKIASIDEAMQGLINLYKIKLDRLQELKKSLLQKAFAGELTQKDLVL